MLAAQWRDIVRKQYDKAMILQARGGPPRRKLNNNGSYLPVSASVVEQEVMKWLGTGMVKYLGAPSKLINI